MFRSSFPHLLRKSKPTGSGTDTIITAWTIRHPTRNRNDPIARASSTKLSYIPPEPSGAMHEGVRCFFYSFPWAQLGHPGLEPETSAREVNHRTYGPTNWERINRFLFGSDSSFPNAAYNSPLYCALQVCLFPPSSLPLASPCEITPMRRKKKALRDPPGPTLDTY
ncbi:Malic enzyme [Quillaja saponaria]|uniref:Malic enzyme n=1 Tax=Quillaja saponaria TaxID=32244 RepID=A0AAD7KLH4_QUISA|nr:Malic enzyme [Quillaja saponaria]